MLGVALGAHLVEGSFSYYGPVMAALCAGLVCAAGHIVNDLVDINIDRVNRPDRVMVRKALSHFYAITLAIILSVTAMGIALTISSLVAFVVLMAIGLLLAYNLKLKRVTFLGNVVIAFLAGLTFLTGGLAVNIAGTFQLPGPLIPALFAFLFHLVREIVKDVQDIEGDQLSGVKTLPQIIGVKLSLWVSFWIFLALVVMTLIPVKFGWFGSRYELIMIYILDLPLGTLLLLMCLRPSERMLQTASIALKIGMVIGILAIWVA